MSMEATQPQLERTQSRQLARFERMGLSVRPMSDGLSLLVSLPLSAAPLESVTSTLLPRRVVFSTVGPHHIKCLRPRAFFGLAMIDVRRCADAASIEAAIRQAWRNRTLELKESRSTLRNLGLEVEAVEEDSALAFPLAGELPHVQVVTQRLGEVILPSLGPLAGLPLAAAHDRVLEVSDCLDSAADLECRVATRVAELRQRRVNEEERNRKRVDPAPALRPPPKKRAGPVGRRPKILLVGPQLMGNEKLLDELTRQGFVATRCPSESEALRQFASMSPDLVLSQYALGRSDGASFVQATCGIAGIERIPVVLLDGARHDSRREVARAVGAAGYMREPTETERFVSRLVRLVQEPGHRRFTRYDQRLAARLEGAAEGCLITELSRGGVFIATPQIIDSQTEMRCKMALPDIGKALIFEGEVRYCNESQGAVRQGIGLRFFDMSPSDESTLIEYLNRLESKN